MELKNAIETMMGQMSYLVNSLAAANAPVAAEPQKLHALTFIPVPENVPVPEYILVPPSAPLNAKTPVLPELAGGFARELARHIYTFPKAYKLKGPEICEDWRQYL